MGAIINQTDPEMMQVLELCYNSVPQVQRLEERLNLLSRDMEDI